MKTTTSRTHKEEEFPLIVKTYICPLSFGKDNKEVLPKRAKVGIAGAVGGCVILVSSNW